MADGDGAIGEIDRAFRQEGFERDWAATPKIRYRGPIKCNNTTVLLSVDVPDFDFVTAPDIRIDNLADLTNRVLPHVFGDDGSLCYMERTSSVLDRYDPGGTIVFCLAAAKRTLEDAISGKSDRDLAAEFFAYWGRLAYVDLPKSFGGDSVVISWLSMTDGDAALLTPIVTEKDKIAETFVRRHKSLTGSAPISSATCSVLHLPIVLTVSNKLNQWPPKTLADVLLWLGGYATKFTDLLRKAILAGTAVSWLMVLRAKNGDFLVLVKLPIGFDKTEFTETRRASLPDLLLKKADATPIERFTGWPISSEYVFGRNLHGMANFVNKKIMLIGCGTIGGFLAQQLAQSGAGAGEKGDLCLVDIDNLSPANLGRHLLGVPYLAKNKAEGCQQFLSESIPHLRIRAMQVNALELRPMMKKFDLIIDATGEEAFSIALNQYAIDAAPKFPPVLFAWLLGNGAAVQSLYFDGGDHACFKCLKPIMNEPPRYDMLREKSRFVRNLACGDPTYLPFPVSRSVQAASLALEMALSWARSDVRHRFQGRVLDSELAKPMKDGNPEKSKKCPACRVS